MKTATDLSFTDLPATYEGLVKLHMPRPIHDKTGYDNAVEVVDVLAVAGPQLNADQADYLDLLATLIERYEAQTLPKPPRRSRIGLLTYLMEEHSWSAADLAKALGVHRSVAYRILKGERSLTAAHAKALAARFHVRADMFL